MAARIAGVAAEANQTLQFHSGQLGGLLNQINASGVVQGRLITTFAATPMMLAINLFMTELWNTVSVIFPTFQSG
jgi:hypothetical protein